MSKNDGSLSIGGRVTPLMELMLRRRSCRRYEAGQIPDDAVEYLLSCAHDFQSRCGFQAPRISVLPRGPEWERVVRAATAGIFGAVNPWLPSCAASHLLIGAVVYPDQPRALELALEQAAMTMQVAVLAATEAGCGTCWMAGINHDRVEETYRFEDGARLVALSPIGWPPKRMGLSWDALTHHLVSKRRRPLAALWMQEGWR